MIINCDIDQVKCASAYGCENAFDLMPIVSFLSRVFIFLCLEINKFVFDSGGSGVMKRRTAK